MNIFGLTIARTRNVQKALAPVDNNRGAWWPIVRESFAGAWQQNIQVTLEDALQYGAVFRCIQIIAADVSKMRLKLVEMDARGLWSETTSPAFSPVMREPNSIQTRIQFFKNWMESKLTHGNTYVLKGRDGRGVVTSMQVLDPCRVRVFVSEDGSVFYELRRDDVSGVNIDVVMVPADEIIHDRYATLYHKLVGVSPIYAVGINAITGSRIQQNSARLFTNGARPGGILTAPGAITNETAARLKAHWDDNFTGANAGKVAVIGDGLTYEQMTMSAVDAQLIDQLKWNDATIAGVFGVPAYMINAGTTPAYNNVEALTLQYFSQCLQVQIEEIEALLDKGLGLSALVGKTMGVEFDTGDLLRMDTATKVKTAVEGLKGVFAPNEARAMFDLPPITGGETVYLQQQNFSLEALAKRDAKEDPFASAKPTPKPDPSEDDDEVEDEDEADDTEKAIAALQARSLELAA